MPDACSCERHTSLYGGWVVANPLCPVHPIGPDDHEFSPEHWQGQCDCDDDAGE